MTYHHCLANADFCWIGFNSLEFEGINNEAIKIFGD